MKALINFTVITLLLLAGVAIAGPVFFQNTAKAETVVTSMGDANETKATLSNDLKIAYQNTDDGVMAGNFITDHWGELVLGFLAFAEVIVRVTPTEKDNTVLNYLSRIINALIPNRRKGGGVF